MNRTSAGPTPRLDGKVVAISGCGGSIARAAIEVMVAEGARVAGCDRDAAAGAEAFDELSDRGARFDLCDPQDLSEREGARLWIEEVLSRHARIDVVVNCAVRSRKVPFAVTSSEDLEFTMDNQFRLTWNVCQAAWPALEERGGSLVNCSSVSALIGSRGLAYAAHGAANSAIVALTRQLAAEGCAAGIRANSLAIGLVRTPPVRQSLSEHGAASPFADLARATASGVGGEPADVAQAILFLAADESRYVNATNLVVDGGATAFLGASATS